MAKFVSFFLALLISLSSSATVLIGKKLLWIENEILFAGFCEEGKLAIPKNCKIKYSSPYRAVSDPVVKRLWSDISVDQANLDDDIHQLKIKHPDVQPFYLALKETQGKVRDRKSEVPKIRRSISQQKKSIEEKKKEFEKSEKKVAYYNGQLKAVQKKIKEDPNNGTLLRLERAISKDLAESKAVTLELADSIQELSKQLEHLQRAEEELLQEITRLQRLAEAQKFDFDEVYRKTEVTSSEIEWLKKRIAYKKSIVRKVDPVLEMMADLVLQYRYLSLSKSERRVAVMISETLTKAPKLTFGE